MVLVIETDYVTVTPTPTPPAMTVTTLRTLFSPSTAKTVSSVLQTNTPTTLPATNTTLPPAFNPTSNPPSKPNNTIIIILLLLVVVLATLFCSLTVNVIYARCKGKCLDCLDLEKQLRKWENGELKPITKEMVRRREVLNGEMEEVDLEKGTRVHAATLKKLEGRDKLPFWKTLFWKARGKTAEMKELQPAQSTSAISDRFPLVVNPPPIQAPSTSSHTSSSKHPNVDNDIHPLFRPVSSIYSQSTVMDHGPWSFKEYPTVATPSIDSVNQINYPVPQVRPPALFAGGDLANRYVFQDEDEESEHGHEIGSTVSSYKQPEWQLNKRFSDRGRGKAGE